ncbi:MAG TPA: hypothetical protein VFK49_04185 [Stellaceae bacterium]|nr:hypothetical protein [Stellaceae bacterium]
MGFIPDMDAVVAARSTSGESAAELLAALRRGVAEGKVELNVEPKRLNHIDSPVAFEADGNIWAYAALFIAALLWWRWGMASGLAALALGVVVYLTLGRSYMYRRIERRVRGAALDDLEKWRKLWRFAGLTLTAKERRDLAPCASPDGNWMAFTRAVISAAD